MKSILPVPGVLVSMLWKQPTSVGFSATGVHTVLLSIPTFCAASLGGGGGDSFRSGFFEGSSVGEELGERGLFMGFLPFGGVRNGVKSTGGRSGTTRGVHWYCPGGEVRRTISVSENSILVLNPSLRFWNATLSRVSNLSKNCLGMLENMFSQF